MKVSIDYEKLTWMQMHRIVKAIAVEAKRRNPIGINFYVPTFISAATLLLEIAEGEQDNFSSEAGPREPKPRKKK